MFDIIRSKKSNAHHCTVKSQLYKPKWKEKYAKILRIDVYGLNTMIFIASSETAELHGQPQATCGYMN